MYGGDGDDAVIGGNDRLYGGAERTFWSRVWADVPTRAGSDVLFDGLACGRRQHILLAESAPVRHLESTTLATYAVRRSWS